MHNILSLVEEENDPISVQLFSTPSPYLFPNNFSDFLEWQEGTTFTFAHMGMEMKSGERETLA